MKASAPSLSAAPIGEKVGLGTFLDLVKSRLTTLVLLTTVVGFYVAVPGSLNYGLLFHTLLGTGLVACGAAALNELLERDFDARMPRTANRPLPAGILQP